MMKGRFSIQLIGILLVLCLNTSSSLSAEPKTIQSKSKVISPQSLSKIDTRSEVLIHHFNIKLYLFPDRKSDVLRTLRYGEMIFYNSESPEPPNPDWIPLRTSDNLVGYAVRSAVLLLPKNKYLSTLLFESMKLLHLNSTNLNQRMEITDGLFGVANLGAYTGDDFTISRAKAGFALKKTIDLLNKKNSKPDSSPEILDFLNRHQNKILFDYSSNKYYVDSDYFWQLIENNPITKHADYAAYLAAEVLPEFDCKSELSCQLEYLRRSKMRYIYQFPNGNYVNLYFKNVLFRLKEITKDPAAIACFKPIPRAILSEIATMRSYVMEYKLRYRKELMPYIEILMAECAD